MSGLNDSVYALERQLIGLQMELSPATGKKIAPPPPPKMNRAQPQVPSGASRAYSASISSKNNLMYGNMSPPSPPPDHMYGNMPQSLSSPPPPSVAYYNNYDDENHSEHPMPPPSPISSNYSELMQATRPYQQPVNYPTYQNYGEYGYQNSTYESIYEPVELRASLSQAQTDMGQRLQGVASVQSSSVCDPHAQEFGGHRNQISYSDDRNVSVVPYPTHLAQIHHHAGHRNQNKFAEDTGTLHVQSSSSHVSQGYVGHRNEKNFSEDIGVPVKSHRNHNNYLEDKGVPCIQSMSVSGTQDFAGHNIPAQQIKQYAGHIGQNFTEERDVQHVQIPSMPAHQHCGGNKNRNHTSEECGIPQHHLNSVPTQQSQYYRNQVNISEERPITHIQSPSMPATQTPAHGGHTMIQDFSDNRTPHMQSPYRNGPGNRRPLAKEAEVDALTQLLVQSIGEGSESDTYGICVRCHRPVKGEESGCTAMNQIYHVSCFTCAHCNVKLQGVTFYAVDGQPHCEQDYMHTLEKCSVCSKPIKDRILRATGKPYHPACFVCVACGKSLDGIPFTVDAANQIHCIEDFHNKFAPRCCVCSQPIMPEEGQEETVRIVALDRSFHVNCYQCEDCGLLLSSEEQGRGCYPLDDHILCKACNARRIRNLSSVITTDL